MDDSVFVRDYLSLYRPVILRNMVDPQCILKWERKKYHFDQLYFTRPELQHSRFINRYGNLAVDVGVVPYAKTYGRAGLDSQLHD